MESATAVVEHKDQQVHGSTAGKTQAQRGLPHRLEVLSPRSVDKLIHAVFGLLEETGIRFDKHEHAYDLFTQAGCDISSDGIVKFPSRIVEECLAQCPKGYRWWNREGTKFGDYGSGDPRFIAGCWAPHYLDPRTGEKKQGDQDAIALLTRLSDALPEIDISGMPISTGDFIADCTTIVANTTKPVLFSAGGDTNVVRALIELGAVLRGGIGELKEKPYFTLHINPEVLHYPTDVSEQIVLCAEYGIPISIAAAAIGGLSSPVTMAGTLTMCLATTFPGIVLAQMAKDGHPCTETSTPAFMDPATAAIGGMPENCLSDMARAQVCRKLGPLVGQLSAFGGLTPEFNQDYIAKTTWDFAELITSPFDAFFVVASLEAGLANSPHALVYANELASMARRVWKGIPLDDEHLALDLIKNVGSGMYIAEEHTAMHSRTDLWRGRYVKTISRHDWEAGGRKEMSTRIQEDLCEILDTHVVEPLPERVQAAVRGIVEKYGSSKSS